MKYRALQTIYGLGGKVIVNAGDVVEKPDTATVDPVLFERIEVVSEKKLEVATPRKARTAD